MTEQPREDIGSDLNRLSQWDGLAANLATAVFVTDAAGRIVIWNAAATGLFGWRADDAWGRPFLSLLLPPDAELDLVAALASASTGERWSGEVECKRRDGARVPMQLELCAVFGAHGDVIGFTCESFDLSDLKAAKARTTDMIRELRTADARQRAILAWSRDATMFFDADATIRWASPATAELLGTAPDELLGRSGLDLIHPDDQERAIAEFAEMRELGDHVCIEFRVFDPEGRLHWIEEDVTNLVDDPDVGFVVANIRDVTDRRRDQDQLARMALHDPLTGLPNRSLLVNRLEQLLARDHATAVLDIDLDNFRDVNDLLGHAQGDELLCVVGSRLAGAAQQSASTLARVGGDEFVVLCEDVRDAATAVSLAELLRESLRAPFAVDAHEVFVSASIGVALSPGDATGLIRDAGIATHQAKQRGRDRVAIFDARLDSTQRHRLTVQSELRRALERDELEVWYQPIVDLQARSVQGVEALVRWRHPERGLLAPQHFIDVAEASGMIRALGSQVLRQACSDALGWRDAACPLHISVNAAAAQLSSPDFIDEIAAAVHDFELDPERLTIEITETAAMLIADSLENLHRIRRLGVHLALDDFGTGYSSLSFLRELPVDAIKIDRSFISGLGTSERDTSIVQGVLAMAVALGQTVVAEGVETSAQAELLRQLACPFAQGYLWSRPVPADEVQRVVEAIPGALRSL
jgi:diguanylate cyclase (GGDEF)-like protein/PAS domain S-box-containing protein